MLDFVRQVVKASKDTPSTLMVEKARMIHASLARSTWIKYRSGWRAFKEFERGVGGNYRWPLSKEVIRDFTVYCMGQKKTETGVHKILPGSSVLPAQAAGLAGVRF